MPSSSLSTQQTQGFWTHPAEGLKTSADHLRPLTAKDLIRIAQSRGDHLPTTVWFTRTPGDRFDPDASPDEPSCFLISSRGVRLIVSEQVPNADQVDTTEPAPEWVGALLKRLGQRFRLSLLEYGFDERGWGFIEGTYHVPGAYPLSQALELAALAQKAIVRSKEALDITVLYALLGAGVPEALLSLREGVELEVKRSPYLLSDSIGSLELGKDVSSLANSRGGVLAIGFATKRDDHGDLITAIVPCRLDLIQPLRYRHAISRAVYPSLRGLELIRLGVEQGAGYLTIYLPPQPEHLKPFLVRGARLSSTGRIQGSHIGIYRRVGDEAVAITIEELHGLLRAKDPAF